MTSPLAVVLAGGLGTRVQHLLPGLPKPLAPVAGRPFLEWVLRYLQRQGIGRVVLCTGYQADKVDEFVAALSIPGLHVNTVRETEPLGTAGAFVHALQQLDQRPDTVLVCNGDSLVLTSLAMLLGAAGSAEGVILGVRVGNAKRFGTLRTKDGMLLGFEEKRDGKGLVNGGVYLFGARALKLFPRKSPLSFEYDVFPVLVAAGAQIAVVRCQASFIDIGTEQSLDQADDFIRDHMEWFE